MRRLVLIALEPDLIILDEFQRFKHLLDGSDEASDLARGLFDYEDARVLLLSATPYKMYTLPHEVATDDHYKDFVRTARFLYTVLLKPSALRSCLNSIGASCFAWHREKNRDYLSSSANSNKADALSCSIPLQPN